MKLGFIGAGEMGGTMIRGLLDKGWKKEDLIVSVRTPEKANLLAGTLGLAVYTDNRRVIVESERLFLAVKPGVMPSVLAEIASAQVPAKPLISMALGWTVEKIQRVLGNWPVARIMPNMPLGVGEGATLLEFSAQMPPADRLEIKELFNRLGKTYEITADFFDVATALSGSGPAFVYYFLHGLIQGSVQQGLPPEVARALALQTVLGAAKLASQSGASVTQLVQQVATPGGCTAAGVEVLTSSDFTEILREALTATACKAQEISKR